jgi:hypothetical protein
MAQEIQAHLAGADAPDAMINVCSRCGRIGEDAWSLLPGLRAPHGDGVCLSATTLPPQEAT